MSSRENVTTALDRDAATALVDSWIALWNGDYDVAATIISENNRVHAAMLDGGDGSAANGVSGMKDFVGQTISLSSDLVFAIDVAPSSTATTSSSAGLPQDTTAAASPEPAHPSAPSSPSPALTSSGSRATRSSNTGSTPTLSP